ncbi:hypothetical protein GCM10020255_071910 [Rhodococcus baikonurensis]
MWALLSSQFTGDGNLLFITQLGQINVLNPQTGAKVLPSFDLIPPPSIDQGSNAELIPDNKGLNECFLGTAAARWPIRRQSTWAPASSTSPSTDPVLRQPIWSP